ncbi:MAG: RHS repeat-associated core domain-containing protein, partial [Myxococcota bacterium]
PRLPFVTWLVTGVRRTDGLCDVEPEDWFTLAGNPCLAAGHELVQRIEYAEGAYDGLTRSFLGFARTRVFDGPTGIGSLREIVFHQTPALKGRIASETILAGGVDRVSRTTWDWRTVADGARTQVHLQEQRVEESVPYPQFGAGPGDAQCVVHRNSITRPDGRPDPATRIHTACSMACAGAGDSDALCAPAPVGKKQIDTVWAEPVPGVAHPVWDRPAEIVTRSVDGSGALVTIARVRLLYDGLVRGLVDRGRLVAEWSAISEAPVVWAFKNFEYDGGVAAGPGNVTSVHVPVTGADRVPSRIEFDAEFALHPVVESAWVANAGAGAERRVESRWDIRVGKRSERVGLHGRGAGDVAGTVWDSLGRPVCEFAPGTACGLTSGFGATTEYRHVPGTPGAADPIARLSFVEVRRREPNAPQGYLTTRSHFDALGRERLTTNEQLIVDPPAPDGRPALETVVVRQLDYGPNGKPVRSFAPYVAPASGLALAPPGGVAATQTSYVLNGNAAGRLDPAGRVFETIDFDGSRAQTYYLGRILRRVDGLDAGSSGGDHTVEVLDEHGRIRERRSLAGSAALLAAWSGEYDGRDRLVAESWGGSAATRITRRFDLLGRAVETVDPDAGRWRVAYDEAGNEIFRDDPQAGQGIQSCYDGLDRVVLQCARASDAPDPGLCASAQPDCSVVYRFRYDEATPLLGTPNFGLGRLTTAEGPDGRQRAVYDLRGRVVLAFDEVQGEAAVTRYAYRADIDRLEGMTYPDGERVRYGYDEAGQPAWLSEVDAAGNWLAYYVRRIVYDLRGRPLAIERGNLTTDRFEYHDAGERFALARISTRSEGAKVFDPRTVYADLAYRDYDAKGRLLRVDDLRDGTGALAMSAGYAYDGLGRLTAVTGPSPEGFAYDAIGNLVSIGGQTFSRSTTGGPAPGPHQFDRLGDPSTLHWTFAYDANGRRTAKRRSDGAFDQSARYDAFGALRSLVTNGVETTYGYAHDGRRLYESREGTTRRFFGRHAERVNGTLLKFYYLGDRLIATRSDPPTTTGASPLPMGSRTGWAPGARATSAFDRLVATAPLRLAGIALAAGMLLVPMGRSRRALGLRVARSGALGGSLLVLVASLPLVVPTLGCLAQANVRHYHLNHLGSPIAITGPGGTLERQYRYSAYGEVRRFDGAGQPVGPDATSRREFTGYEGDGATGLQYAGSRYYDPATAGFLTPDPADEHASPYAYVGWDPINAVDPNGAELSLVAAILLAISAVLVVASAIVAGVQSGSASVGFQALGIGIAGLAAGYVVGLAAPAAAAASLISETSAAAINASLSVASIGTSIYGMTVAEDPGMLVLAGAGLALSLAGAAYALGSLARPQAGVGGMPGVGGTRPAPGWPDPPGLVRTRAMSPQLAQRLALEAQRRMVQFAQFTALAKVKAGIAEIRAAFAGRTGIDVYAEVLIEGPRIPHPTRLFAQHLLPNRVEVTPVVTPTGRGPMPTLMAPVPWDRFRLHEFVPVLRNGVAVPAR